MNRSRRLIIFAQRTLLTVLAALAGIVSAGQIGLFSGTRPTDLGAKGGLLKPAPATPNCVNSQSTTGYSAIAPIAFSGDGGMALAKVTALVGGWPGATLIENRPDYLYAEFRTRLMGFVDDVEFLLDDGAKVIHVRSASRLGKSDMGVNRQRVEALRKAFNSGVVSPAPGR